MLGWSDENGGMERALEGAGLTFDRSRTLPRRCLPRSAALFATWIFICLPPQVSAQTEKPILELRADTGMRSVLVESILDMEM